MTRYRTDRWLMTFALATLCQISNAAPGLPEGMLLVGMEGGTWHAYLKTAEGLSRIETAGEPRSPALKADKTRLAYISPAGRLREVRLDNAQDTVLLTPDASVSFTQPTYGPRGSIYVVTLKDGSSADTDIQRLDRDSGQLVPAITQRSAQFEPSIADATLLYGNVSCTADCGRVIQEIWMTSVIAMRPAQLTMLNAVSRQPYLHGEHVYFSSNRDGYFHIWRVPLDSHRPERLTSGVVTDSQPIMTDQGLYFLRKTRDGTEVMVLLAEGEPTPAILDRPLTNVKDIRYAR